MVSIRRGRALRATELARTVFQPRLLQRNVRKIAPRACTCSRSVKEVSSKHLRRHLALDGQRIFRGWSWRRRPRPLIRPSPTAAAASSATAIGRAAAAPSPVENTACRRRRTRPRLLINLDDADVCLAQMNRDIGSVVVGSVVVGTGPTRFFRDHKRVVRKCTRLVLSCAHCERAACWDVRSHACLRLRPHFAKKGRAYFVVLAHPSIGVNYLDPARSRCATINPTYP